MTYPHQILQMRNGLQHFPAAGSDSGGKASGRQRAQSELSSRHTVSFAHDIARSHTAHIPSLASAHALLPLA